LQLDEDPLLAAVSLLEANWISVQETFELVNRVLTWIFVGLWPKKRANVPDLKDLAKAFDTEEDPILTMKGLSLKRGAEGAIAFAYSHGEEVNWEKVSSSLGRPRSELKPFFEKAKKYAPGIVSMISPSAASATGTVPISTPDTSVLFLLLMLVLLLLRLLPLQIVRPRWRRLGLPCNFSFILIWQTF
jgi:hypothetical protein